MKKVKGIFFAASVLCFWVMATLVIAAPPGSQPPSSGQAVPSNTTPYINPSNLKGSQRTPQMSPTKIQPETILPFKIAPQNMQSKYLHPFILRTSLRPNNDSQEANDAIVGRNVRFYINGNFVGEAKSSRVQNLRHAEAVLNVLEHNSRQLNLQVGTHEIIAQTHYEGYNVKGLSKLEIVKAGTDLHMNFVNPRTQEPYKMGQTVTVGAILTTNHSYPIANVNVNCSSFHSEIVGTSLSIQTPQRIGNVKTNSQGGFECPITLTPAIFENRVDVCNIMHGKIGVSYDGNQNFYENMDYIEISACPSGTNYAVYDANCPVVRGEHCRTCCK